MTDIGDKIREMRKARRLSRQDLAESSGVSMYSIRAYEQGRRKPKQETTEAIMNAMHYFPTVDEYKQDLMNDDQAMVDLALDNVGYKWKHKPLTAQQVSAMRAVVKSLVESDQN